MTLFCEFLNGQILDEQKESMPSWRENLISTAQGNHPADLVILNGQLVNVCTHEIYPAGIATTGNRLAMIGDVETAIGPKTEVIDAQGMYLVPGLIDSHIHSESSGISLTQLARLLLPRGVTTIMYAHEIANVLGLEGMKLVRQESQQIPLKIFFEVPTSVPWASGLEMPATSLSVDEVCEMLAWPESVSLGESDYFDVLKLEPHMLAKLDAARALGKPVNGHAAKLSGKPLMAIAGAAFDDDHENSSPEEVIEKLRLGMKVILREANLPWLAPAVTHNKIDTRNLLLCTDDKPVNRLRNEGGVDNTVRIAIISGIEPVTAIQMATINAAEHFNKSHELGSITPGKIADILITDSLENLDAQIVIANGEVVARRGNLLLNLPIYNYPAWSKNSIHLKKTVSAQGFELHVEIKKGSAQVRVLMVSQGGWVKTWKIEKLPIESGLVVLPEILAINRIAVIERHGGDGNIALGLISGIGLKHGAVASSVAHDCHNIIVVGTDLEDMALCVNTLSEIGGGFVAVDQGEILAQVQFEVAGLISEAPYEEVADQLDKFAEVIRDRLDFASDIEFGVLNFISLQSSPHIAAITDRGLIDTYSSSILPLVLSLNPD